MPPLLRLFGARRPPRSPRLCRHEALSPRILPGADGVRIGQISDVHARAGVRPRRLEHAVRMMNALRPDFVVLTGDYVCVTARPAALLTLALSRLEVPAYAILGNHDHWSGAGQVASALERAGVDVLRNEHRAVPTALGSLFLVGVDDSVTGHQDPERAFRGVPPEATCVVLSHDPRSVSFLAAYRPALILSGHTHGGQVVLPRVTPFMAARIGYRHLAGLYEVDGALLYVSRGLGAALPLRFRSPPEVAELTLRAAAARLEAASKGAA